MSGVYNRKLFRQSGARDELRKLGGIMSSSEELMREALMTGMRAPGPADLGPMPMPQQPVIGMPAPPVMQPQQPMVEPQQPMDMGMQQPMDSGYGMQQPMDMGMPQPMDSGYGMQPSQPMMQQQPIQPPIAEPSYMPPQMPQSLQMEPKGFKDGSLVTVDEPATRAGRGGANQQASPTAIEDSFLGGLLRRLDEAVLGPQPTEAVDIGDTAGTVAIKRLEELPPYALANKILEEGRREGITTITSPEDPAPDPEAVRMDLAKILEQMAGDSSAYEKNIDELNRGIIGAAIASGTSARATENIAKGMLAGLEGVKATEERRAGDAQALQLKALEVRAAEQAAREAEIKAQAKAKSDAAAKREEDKRRVYSDVYLKIIESGVDGVNPPEGMSIEQYAAEQAERQSEYLFPTIRELTPEAERYATAIKSTIDQLSENVTLETTETRVLLQEALEAINSGVPADVVLEELERNYGIKVQGS